MIGIRKEGPGRALTFVLFFNGLFVLWLLLRPGSHALVVAVDNVAQFVGQLTILPLCVGLPRLGLRGSAAVAQAQPAQKPGRRWAPIFLGLGILSMACGQIIYTVYEQILHYATAPFPSWADAGYLLVYPFLLGGILLLPARRLPLAQRTRVFFDGVMIMATMATFSWYFILGPTILAGADSLLGQIVGAAYPLCDLVLICCLLLLSAHFGDPALRRVVILLWVALACIVVTDSAFDYLSLHNAYHTGELLDVGWTLGYMLVGVAGYSLRRSYITSMEAQHDGQPAEGDRYGDGPAAPAWRILLPYLVIPATCALILFGRQNGGDPSLTSGIYIGSATLVLLVLLRQIMALLENRQLNARLRDMYRQTEANNRALAAANARLQALATTDALTDLLNHRAMIAALDQELERARRYSRPCSVLFLDLDHFKSLNDGYGHAAGDTVLTELATLIRRTLRGIDTAGRWGGEEFVCLLPETDEGGVLHVAERLRAAVAAYTFGAGGGMHLTCSVGTATYPTDGEERVGLVDAADRAMYAAKSFGRNQVRRAADPVVQALAVDSHHSTSREDVALQGTVEALAALVEARDHYTGEHTTAVGALATQVAVSIGLHVAESRMIGLAGRLHDIGKVGVPDAILQKPGTLTEDEWTLMRRHPGIGADVVGRVPALRVLAPLIRAHHERWDGQGYPDGLAGEAIPLGARIIALADAYGAMTSNRPYRLARDPEWAMGELRRCAGRQFDPALVEALERVLAAGNVGAISA